MRSKGWMLGRGAATLAFLMILTGAQLGQARTVPYAADLGAAGPVSIRDGVHEVVISLWSEAVGGELAWEEKLEQIYVRKGRFDVILGRLNPLPADAGSLWVELVVAGELISPRVPLGGGGLEVEGSVLATSSFNLGPGNLTVSSGRLISFSGPLQLSAGDGHSALEALVLRRNSSNVAVAYLENGTDASLSDGSGYLVLGDEAGDNVVIDANEIMARSNGSTSTLFLQQNGGAVFVNGSQAHASDRTLKRDIRDLDLGIEELRRLRPVSYAWKSADDDRRHLGLIAQEVQEVVPDLIYEGEEETLGLSYVELVPLLVKALQTQDAELQSLRDRLAALEGMMASPR